METAAGLVTVTLTIVKAPPFKATALEAPIGEYITHFTAQRVQDWANDVGIRWLHHLPYTPTANGLIERMNGFLKDQIDKT